MNSRKHRAALEAKRGDLSRHAGRGYPVDDLTDEQCIAIDAAWDKAKTDPAEQRRREHALIQDQAQMLHIMRRSM